MTSVMRNGIISNCTLFSIESFAIVSKVIISIVIVSAGITQYLVNPPSGQGFFDSSGRGDGVGGLERNAVAVVVAVAERRKKSFL